MQRPVRLLRLSAGLALVLSVVAPAGAAEAPAAHPHAERRPAEAEKRAAREHAPRQGHEAGRRASPQEGAPPRPAEARVAPPARERPMPAAPVFSPPPAHVAVAMRSGLSGKCLDLAGGARGDDAAVIQYDCNNGENQQWLVEDAGGGQFRLVNRLSGKCLAPLHSARDGVYVTQTSCAFTQDQFWTFAGRGALQNAGAGLCLDSPGAAIGNGVRLILWPCNGGRNQAWTHRP